MSSQDWLDRNIAERLSFSTFSRHPNDVPAAGGRRDYAIAVLPGYRVPARLDRSHKDALWLDRAPDRPVIAWDGFCPYALHEIVYECFGFAPGETDGKICVIRLSDKKRVEDDRSAAVMALRPARLQSATGRNMYLRRVADLFAWSTLIPSSDAGGRGTRQAYDGLFLFARDGRNESSQSSDDKRREGAWFEAALGRPRPSAPSAMAFGPSRSLRDDSSWVASPSMADDVRRAIRASRLRAFDIDVSSPPESLFSAMLGPDRDPETGLLHGEEQEARRAHRETFDRETFDREAPEAHAPKDGRTLLQRVMGSGRKPDRF